MSAGHAANIEDLRRHAQRRLPRIVFDYLDGGAEDEKTLGLNRQAFDRLRFKPRVLVGGEIDISTELFGRRLAAPFMIGPTGLNGIFWPDADLHLARAAAGAGIAFALSTASNTSLEDVARVGDGVRWFQLYPWGQPEVSERLIRRAEAAGYDALVVTVDSLITGKRERDIRNGFSHEWTLSVKSVIDGMLHPRWLASVWFGEGMPRFENLAEFLPPGATATEIAEFTRSQRNPRFDWEDIARVRRSWNGPLLVKGIMSEQDALIARREGVDGVVVSNHGGRQLDGTAATMDVLSSVVKAVGDDMPVLIDGGFRRGTDILKAVALGARAVLLGRATLYGVAAHGEAGVARAIRILTDEISCNMRLMGCPRLSSVIPAMVMPAASL